MDKFIDFISRNKIEKYEKLFAILQYMFKSDFYFSRPYIALENTGEITNRNVILQHLKDVESIEIDDLKNICEEYGIHYMAGSALIESLQPDFIRIDENTLMRIENIGITDEIISSVIENVQNAIDRNGGYQSAKNFSDYGWLPHLSVSWNAFILESVVNLADDSIHILRINTSSTYIPTAIFVDERYEEDDLNSFLLKVLKAEHENDPFSSTNEILQWLQEQGLCNIKLPDFLTSEGHITFDENNKLIIQ